MQGLDDEIIHSFIFACSLMYPEKSLPHSFFNACEEKWEEKAVFLILWVLHVSKIFHI